MAELNKIDSNVTGLRVAQEASLGVLPTTPKWIPQEPNSYAEFGGSVTTVARNPINPSRQRKKGVVTDLDANAGYASDITQNNMQDLLQGFFFARQFDKEEHGGSEFNIVDTAVINAGGTGYAVNDVLTVAPGAAGYSRSGRPCTLLVTSVSSGVIDGISIQFHGEYDVNPSTLTANPVTGGTGSGATFDLTMLISSITNVDGTANEYDSGGGLAFAIGELIFASGFTNAANNGLKRVTGVTSDTNVAVSDTGLVDETPPAAAKLVEVGFQFGADEVDIDVSGSLPALSRTSGSKDLTELGITPGEWVYIGGDTAITGFSNSANNGFARVRSVTSTLMTFDKTSATMVAEVSSGSRTIQIFTGRLIKNQLGSEIVRRTYQMERELGVPDDASPTAKQAEYVSGCVAGEMSLNIPTADKATVDLTFQGTASSRNSAATGLKSGDRPSLVEADAFNTSSDVKRIRMSQVTAGNAFPTPLFAFLTEMTISINNNVSPNKAVGVLGAFEVTAGTFAVSGTLTAYFQNTAAVDAVNNNSDITLDMAIVKANAGIVIDIPLIALGDGRPNVEQDEPITLPLAMEAATAAKIDATLDHTLLMVFFDYLPTVADV